MRELTHRGSHVAGADRRRRPSDLYVTAFIYELMIIKWRLLRADIVDRSPRINNNNTRSFIKWLIVTPPTK